MPSTVRDDVISSPRMLRPGRLAAILGAMTAIGPLTIDMYLPALPTIARHFAVTDAAAQATLTGSLLGLAGGQLLVGPLADAFGRRRPLIAGLVLHLLASVLCAFAPDIEVLTVARTLQGIGASAGAVVALAIIRDLYTGMPAAKLMSRLMLVTGVAPVLAPTIGSFMLRATSWNGLFVVLAVAGGLLASLAAFALPETNPPERRQRAGIARTFRSYGSLIGERQFIGLCLAAGLAMTVILGYVSGSSFVLQQQYGMSTAVFGLVFAANSVGLISASQVNPTLLRRFTASQILAGAMIVCAIASAAMVVLTATGALGLWGLLIPLFVALAMAGLALPNVPALALAPHGARAGTAAALLGACQFGIGAMLSPLVGFNGTVTAATMAVVIFGAAVLGVLVLVFVVRPRSIATNSADAEGLVALH
ncbi:DHA1 family bicyclomycin/chloramphenicol resistance-like MFS transporter [Nakamurella sp. UYEF19]|uniref:multidrug effflux MFS transporter n=1 Tax=Nakamurella sp. UYEF19 TaxID=1756392 RepID=UPI003394F7BA